ncbi:tRNA lysidine(34) synthetase TilS [Alteribacter populi]|uniref:tRNA lysidine(34) synthetase TilS n=1 Tax=Alteribacter populi TaxID=2011011 RepID=UPI000BBABA0E|nr:tRNA lysidine(34) synthetase TilS [Alteribacter populi]
MKQTVDRFIDRNGLIKKGDTVLVATSGGPDSIGLLHYLLSKAETWHLDVYALHVEHGLRGESSIEDMTFVKQFCVENQIPYFIEQVDVRDYAKKHGLTTQAAARKCRYAYFEKKMKELNAQALAMGHHGDDQVETMVMRQVRGARDGLRGIPVRRSFTQGNIIRPFLCISKDDIIDYCSYNGLSYRVDESNNELNYTRNRFRHHVLPFLKQENPKVHERFQQQSEWLKEDGDYLLHLTEEKIAQAVLKKRSGEIVLSISDYLNMPIPLQRRGFHLILNYLSIDENQVETLSVHMNAFLDLLQHEHPSGSLNFPGDLFVRRSYDTCVLSVREKEEGSPKEKKAWQLSVPGIVPFNEGKITASVLQSSAKRNDNASMWSFAGKFHELPLPLTVRSRQKGDRISPIGMKGSKKVKDLFMDKKVPRHLRDRWPVVVDQKDRIIWIPGLARSSVALVTDQTQDVLFLKCELDAEFFGEGK